MKRVIVSALIALLLVAPFAYKLRPRAPKPFHPNRAVSRQEKASHMLIFSEHGRELSECSGTAIGPHAILTAEHCDERGKATEVSLDLSRQRFPIVAKITDDRDHVIYLFDGPALTDIQPYETRAPRIGEPVVLFGFGEAMYPETAKTGIVLDEFDPSEIDADQGMFYTSTHILPGDSGSTIYGADGKMLGLVTYGMHPNGDEEAPETGDFMLGFTAEQIAEVVNF